MKNCVGGNNLAQLLPRVSFLGNLCYASTNLNRREIMNWIHEISAGVRRLWIRDLPVCSRSAYCASLCEHERKNPGKQWPLRMGDLLLNPGDTRVLCVHTRSGKRWQVSLWLSWVLQYVELALNAPLWPRVRLLTSWRWQHTHLEGK